MSQDQKQIRDRLLALRSELEQASSVNAEARSTVTLDQQSVGRLSRMDAMQQQAMARAQESRRQQDLLRIEMALRLLDEGEYGYCLNCGEEISPKRIEIDPMTTHCIRCAGK